MSVPILVDNHWWVPLQSAVTHGFSLRNRPCHCCSTTSTTFQLCTLIIRGEHSMRARGLIVSFLWYLHKKLLSWLLELSAALPIRGFDINCSSHPYFFPHSPSKCLTRYIQHIQPDVTEYSTSHCRCKNKSLQWSVKVCLKSFIIFFDILNLLQVKYWFVKKSSFDEYQVKVLKIGFAVTDCPDLLMYCGIRKGGERGHNGIKTRDRGFSRGKPLQPRPRTRLLCIHTRSGRRF